MFLCLSILSTCAGALLSLIQVLELVNNIYEYLKSLRAKKRQVSPLPLTESPNGTDDILPPIELRNHEDKIIETIETGPLRRQTPLTTQKISPKSKDREMFEDLWRLTPETFEKGPKGKQLYEDLKDWWAIYRSEYGNEINDVSSDRKSSRLKSRTRLFSGNDS